MDFQLVGQKPRENSVSGWDLAGLWHMIWGLIGNLHQVPGAPPIPAGRRVMSSDRPLGPPGRAFARQ